MRAITLMQPWATLVAIGAKRWETRSWPTRYRGPIAIHSSKEWPPWARECARLPAFAEALAGHRMPCGAVVALAELTDCRVNEEHTADELGQPESEFGDFTPGRYRFRLDKVRPLQNPIKARGRLSIWQVSAELAIRIHAQAEAGTR